MSTAHSDNAQADQPNHRRRSFTQLRHVLTHPLKPRIGIGILIAAFLVILSIIALILISIAPPTIEQLLEKQINKVAHDEPSVADCHIDQATTLPSTRYYVIIDCHLKSDSASNIQNSQQIAFALHKAPWTSNLPLGYIITYISLPGWGQGMGSEGVAAGAGAGYLLMSRQDWTQLNPGTWAELLRKNENVKGSDEIQPWYNEFGR